MEEKTQAELIQKLIGMGHTPSNSLAAYVVLYRSLGMCKDVAVVCMEELARRRAYGEEFDYETYIETELAKVPKIEPLNLDSVKGLLNIKALTKMITGRSK